MNVEGEAEMDTEERTRFAARLERDTADIEWKLRHHVPSESAVRRIEHLRGIAQTMGSLIVTSCTPGPEYDAALERLQECLQWAIGAVVRYDNATEIPQTLADLGWTRQSGWGAEL